MKKLVNVIYHADGLLVVNKPAGLVCHPTKTDEYSSLISRVRLFLGSESHPQLVNRLDRETSGVTVVAVESEVARELRIAWENRLVRKEYQAIVHGHLSEDAGVIDAPLGRDLTSRVAVKDCVRPDGLPSQTEFEVVRRFRATNPVQPGGPLIEATLMRLWPRTGRKHQIRIHLAHLGHPLIGDKLYGGDEDLYLALVENRLTPEQRTRLVLPFQALHARELKFSWRGDQRVFRAEAEEWFARFLES